MIKVEGEGKATEIILEEFQKLFYKVEIRGDNDQCFIISFLKC